jgi:hypothetical protein
VNRQATWLMIHFFGALHGEATWLMRHLVRDFEKYDGWYGSFEITTVHRDSLGCF